MHLIYLDESGNTGVDLNDSGQPVFVLGALLVREDRWLRLGQIIEKGFFIDSRTSLPLQLCDLCTYAARRREEQKAGFAVKPLDQHCTPWLDPLVHRGNESLVDVLAWLESQQKKERPGA